MKCEACWDLKKAYVVRWGVFPHQHMDIKRKGHIFMSFQLLDVKRTHTQLTHKHMHTGHTQCVSVDVFNASKERLGGAQHVCRLPSQV